MCSLGLKTQQNVSCVAASLTAEYQGAAYHSKLSGQLTVAGQRGTVQNPTMVFERAPASAIKLMCHLQWTVHEQALHAAPAVKQKA